jgi:hypothetical protein
MSDLRPVLLIDKKTNEARVAMPTQAKAGEVVVQRGKTPNERIRDLEADVAALKKALKLSGTY